MRTFPFVRRTLLSSLALSPLLALGQDAYLTNGFMPLFIKANTDHPVSVRVRNASATPLISFRVDWRWNGGPIQQGYSQTTTGISGNQYWPYEHPVSFNIPAGSGLLKVWAVGSGETNASNDTLTFRVTALDQWATKTFLLDQWTGTWCPQCPPANTAGNTLNNDPQVVAAKHHAVDEFSSGSSTLYFQQYGVDFTPVGVIDQGEYGSYEPNPGAALWGSEIELRKQGVSPVSLAMATDFDALTRMLTVHLGATYTAAIQGEHAMNAFVLEDGLSAPQNNAPPNYIHQQVVRNVLAGPQGDAAAIPAPPVPGETYNVSWNFIVPEDWVANNIRVVGFVTHRAHGGSYTLNALSSSSMVVGVNEQDDLGGVLRMFPNPAKDALWVELPAGPELAWLRVLSVDGREVLVQRAGFSGAPIALDGLPRLAPGVYMLQVVQGNTTVQRRFVKQ